MFQLGLFFDRQSDFQPYFFIVRTRNDSSILYQIFAVGGGIQGSPLGMDFAPWGAKSDARYPCGQG